MRGMMSSASSSVSKMTSAFTSASVIMAPVKGIGAMTSAAGSVVGSAMAPVGKGLGVMTSAAGSAVSSAADMLMPADFPKLFASSKADISGFYHPDMDNESTSNGAMTSAAGSVVGSAMAPVGKGLGVMTSAAGSAVSSAADMLMPADFPKLFASSKADISGFYHPDMDNESTSNDVSDETREFLAVSGHNLHSVLSNPRGGNWGDALLDALTLPGETEAVLSAMLTLPTISRRDFDGYMKNLSDSSALYAKNHERPVREQLASANVPTVQAANGSLHM
ncbi:hypothetical protein DYB31_000256 [Aphanomyces astaci]|uniref:Uncharacterized protein n=1 Tax=Aphanomyces astaci TaxID=112090 RepID=A0A397FA07_APHAT|nr:hypothetical protein DYB31_000256 [Aphanomyces astaci]